MIHDVSFWYDRENCSKELHALGKHIGYSQLPPDIETFIKHEFYLGDSVDIYPFWIEKLKEIYPSPIHTNYLIASLNCAIGSGKSTVSKIMGLYNYCRLDHLENIGFLGLGTDIQTKPLVLGFNHTSVDKAKEEFTNSLYEMMEKSAYFSRNRMSNHNIIFKEDAVRTNNFIGADVIFFSFSEINFINNYGKMYSKLESALGRYKSRFIKCIGYFGNIVLDSSPSTKSSLSNDFIKNNDSSEIYKVFAPIWDAKRHLGQYFKDDKKISFTYKDLKLDPAKVSDYSFGMQDVFFVVHDSKGKEVNKIELTNSSDSFYISNKINIELKSDKVTLNDRNGSFFTYSGDKENNPFIIDDIRSLDDKYDVDKIIVCPKELIREFKGDIYKSLQDHAGVSTESSSSFFNDKKKIIECMTLKDYVPDDIILDYFDTTDTLYKSLSEIIEKALDKSKKIFIRFDIGVTIDKTGMAIGYFSDYVYPDLNNSNYKEIQYHVPIVASISRKLGQATAIHKLTEFVIELSKKYEIGGVSCDQYQSLQLLQDLEILGIQSKYISVDRTNNEYNYLKNCIYNNNIKLPKNEMLKDELLNLQLYDKVQHLPNKSKDISDALSGVISHIYQEIGESDQLSSRYSLKETNKSLKEYTQMLKSKSIQPSVLKDNVLRNIYKK